MASGIQVILPYKHWVMVMEAVDETRKGLLEAAAARKTTAAVRAIIQSQADIHTFIGEEISGQLECTAHDDLPPVPGTSDFEEIADPRDGSDPTSPAPRRGKRKNGPLANL